MTVKQKTNKEAKTQLKILQLLNLYNLIKKIISYTGRSWNEISGIMKSYLVVAGIRYLE